MNEKRKRRREKEKNGVRIASANLNQNLDLSLSLSSSRSLSLSNALFTFHSSLALHRIESSTVRLELMLFVTNTGFIARTTLSASSRPSLRRQLHLYDFAIQLSDGLKQNYGLSWPVNMPVDGAGIEVDIQIYALKLTCAVLCLGCFSRCSVDNCRTELCEEESYLSGHWCDSDGKWYVSSLGTVLFK